LHTEQKGTAAHAAVRQAAENRDYLAQKFEALASNIALLDRQAGDVVTRSRQIRDEPGGDRVSYGCEHDWNDRCRLLCRDYRPDRMGDDDIDLEPDELGCDLGEPLGMTFRPAIFD
jgi:hypothetical protein